MTRRSETKSVTFCSSYARAVYAAKCVGAKVERGDVLF